MRFIKKRIQYENRKSGLRERFTPGRILCMSKVSFIINAGYLFFQTGVSAAIYDRIHHKDVPFVHNRPQNQKEDPEGTDWSSQALGSFDT